MPVDIVPIEESHIDGFHRALDFVARERRYLAFLEAPLRESTRTFVLDNIKRGRPEFVAVAAGEVVGWCDVLPKDRPTMPMAACWAWAFYRHFAARASAPT
jgi:hypothetical protein